MANDPDYSFILEARHAIEASTARHAAMRAAADKENQTLLLMRRSAGRISPRGRRAAFIWRSRKPRTMWCCCKPHARFLRRPAILRQTGRQRMYRSARILKADGTTPGGDGRHSGR